ncbi:MAG: efflux transporter outer rane subunit, partial [Alphaproteobacteria bacterium]|nr:efflux transporter outer rane subunit [Alphaproteobacteria bacterium]
MKRFAALLATTSLLAACGTVGPNYRPPSAQQLAVPDAYFGAAPSPSPAELQDWWKQLRDPELDSIVARAIAGNLDLTVAETRLRQAREALVQARASLLPQVSATGSVGRSQDVKGNGHNSFSVGGDASWEADLFGGISRGIEAAGAEAQSTGYDLASVRVATVGEVVANYVQARLAQQQLVIARATLVTQDDNLQIARWRVQAGLVSSIDIEQARGQRAQTAATIPTFENQFSAAVFRLGVLTGQAPASLMAELQAPAPIPRPPADIATGIPADTLRQRPDVRAAERTLAAQTARIGVAEAQLRPRLTLGGNIGASAFALGSLVDTLGGSLLASLGQVLFDGGRLRSQVRGQQAAAEGALATYRQTVLTALEDVENGLSALRTAKARQAEYAVALDAANNQAILARSQYRAGLSDFQTLLEAERAL